MAVKYDHSMTCRFFTPALLIDHKTVGQKVINGVPLYNARVITESVPLAFSIFANGICSRLYAVPRCLNALVAFFMLMFAENSG